ncbi:MAG: transcriptional repressor [Phototrophicales bacterium]|nr:MAG: transcriptional repressor [Phototrophicales bacterium]
MSKSARQQIVERLRNAGYKLTKPRQHVAEVLLESHRHLSAPEIVELVLATDDSIGRMSVYRTLELFASLGIVRPAFQDGPHAHYVVILDGHHHHLVCQQCGKVVHFDDMPCPVQELEKQLGDTYGFHISGHFLEFFGECHECHQKLHAESH